LLYRLDYDHETEQNILKQAKRFNKPIPERMQNKSDLFIGLELYYNAFFELDTERNHTMGLVKIPRSKIVEYAKEYDFTYEQKEDLIFYITRMDKAHMKRLSDKLPK